MATYSIKNEVGAVDLQLRAQQRGVLAGAFTNYETQAKYLMEQQLAFACL